LIAELQRRRVFRALVGYGIAAFAVLQIIEPLMHGLHWRDEVLSYVVVALAVGFPIVVSLAWIFDVNAGRIERTAPSPASALRGVRLALLLVGIGVLAAAPGIVWYFFLPGRARVAAAAAPSVAVLPFADMSAGKDQEYFSDGVAEEILDALAQIDGLQVAGRTSSFSFKGKSDDLRSIGEKLNVAHILEGSVRKEGNHVRITAQLVNAASGFHLWSQTYDRELTGVFIVQDEIARAVVTALRVKLQPGKGLLASEYRTAVPEAYNQYLLGRRFVDRGSPESLRSAELAFNRAVALDPSYAPAWAELSFAIFVAELASTYDAANVLAASSRKALEAADKAIQLAPSLAEAWAARGYLRTVLNLDWQGAHTDLERALALGPGDAKIRAHSAMLRAALGRMPEAAADASRATELDPLSARCWWWLGNIQLRSGRLDLAERAMKRSLEISPEFSRAARDLGFVYLLQGRPEAALVSFERSTDEIMRLTGRVVAWHDLGRATDSAEALRAMVDRFGAPYPIAQVYAWAGNLDQAFFWLGRAYDIKDSGLIYLEGDPLLSKLHQDPRWAALLKRLNLPVE
jgi:TolB-like protein/tetratricopeptide (TPR) repeat protein